MLGGKLNIFVLADDLTGAAEIGGMAFQYGLTARILLSRKDNRSFPEDVTIIDTGSRGLEPEQAYQSIREITSGQDMAGFDLVYKKVDSVLRGPVVAEIRALLAKPDFDRVLIIPANPSRKRIIQGGRYFIGGVPINETGFRLDPMHPRISAWICEMLDDDRNVVTGHDPAVLSAGKIFIPDIGSEEEISDLLSKITPSYMLHCGGSDFFRAILSHRFLLKPIHDPLSAPTPVSHHFITGSRSESSLNTAGRLKEKGYDVFALPGQAIREKPVFIEWTERIRKAIEKGGNVVVTGPFPIMDDPEDAGKIAGLVARAAKAIVEHAIPGTQLYMEGGETASEYFRIMGWDHLTISRVHDVGVVTLQHENTDLQVTVKPGSYAWPEKLL